MADRTKIEWTDATWNIVTGCSVVSPGCTNCYAMRLAGGRLKGHPSRKGLTAPSKAGPVWNGQVRFNGQWLTQPLHWKRPRRIFVAAHGDLFHPAVAVGTLDNIFTMMARAPQHSFQILTKRPNRMCHYVTDLGTRRYDFGTVNEISYCDWPLKNVWLGTSVEDQARAVERIPYLLRTPAAVRFISAEPLLGELYLRNVNYAPSNRGFMDSLTGQTEHVEVQGKPHAAAPLPALDWVIAGGESGPGARPCHPDWVRDLRDQCAGASVPFHFKQWGDWLPWEPERGPCWISQNGRSEDHHVLFPAEMDDDPTWDDGLAYIADGERHAAFQLVGKKAAGRKLDGVTHDGFPEVSHA